MLSGGSQLNFERRVIEQCNLPVVRYSQRGVPGVPQRNWFIELKADGTIINSIVDGEKGRAKQRNWKIQIASTVRQKRGSGAWNSDDEFAVSIGLRFHANNHGGQTDANGRARLDAENFIKPIVDAIAAGLFSDDSLDLNSIERWDYDDSNFNTLLIHRFDDVQTPRGEGVIICVSANRRTLRRFPH